MVEREIDTEFLIALSVAHGAVSARLLPMHGLEQQLSISDEEVVDQVLAGDYSLDLGANTAIPGVEAILALIQSTHHRADEALGRAIVSEQDLARRTAAYALFQRALHRRAPWAEALSKRLDARVRQGRD